MSYTEKDIAANAKDFRPGGLMCFESFFKKGMTLSSPIILLCISIELFLKAILKINGINKKGHNLLTLFECLPTELQDIIKIKHGRSEFMFDIKLEGASNAFVEWRYIYEKFNNTTHIGFVRKFSLILEEVFDYLVYNDINPFNENIRYNIERCEKASGLDPIDDDKINKWGIAISNLAELMNDEELHLQSIEKYKKAIVLNPMNRKAFYNLGIALFQLSELKNDEELFMQSVEKLKKSVDLGFPSYNLACIYARKEDKKNALKYLKESLIQKDISVEFVKDDEDWKAYISDVNFLKLLKKYQKKIDSGQTNKRASNKKFESSKKLWFKNLINAMKVLFRKGRFS